jgi:2-polyprenyl-3-methyl-5-hydroxy-6-metoxy-1,4-benzoquinol methylase
MNIEKNNVYEYEVDLAGQNAPVHVMHLVGTSKRVLEIGCGPGSVTKLLAQHGKCRVTGIELDADAIKKATPYCEKIIQTDLNSGDWPHVLDGLEPFDVVVAADVLEHLYDPWTTLKRMASFIGSNGYLVISLPHVGHAGVMSCIINSDFEYRDCGLLDWTHIRFFGFRNMEALFAQAELKIVEVKYVILHPKDTNLAENWSRLSVTVQDAIRSSPYSDVYQVVVKAVPLSYPGDAIPLAPPEQRFTAVVIASPASWRKRIAQHLSPRQKQHIRSTLKLFRINL